MNTQKMKEEENEVKTERRPLKKTKKVERKVKTVTVYKLNIKHTNIIPPSNHKSTS